MPMKLFFALIFASLAGASSPSAPQVRPSVVGPDSVYVPILVYHGVFPHHPGQTAEQIEYDVSPENFETQMQYLKDSGYRVISLLTLVDALEKGDTIPAK